ncbi:hypothetical protein D3C83_33910 [compost metagenome]
MVLADPVCERLAVLEVALALQLLDLFPASVLEVIGERVEEIALGLGSLLLGEFAG